jgi:Zn-dependent protease
VDHPLSPPPGTPPPGYFGSPTPEPAYEPPAAPAPAPAPRPERADSLLRRLFGPLIGALLVLAKFGKVALLALTKIKFLGTAGSMLVSIGAYALIWGWKFGAAAVALIFVHEMGHVIQLRREGIRATAPMFIPFMGAFVGMKELPKDAAAEARVGLAGPVLGTLGTLVPMGIWLATGEPFWQAITFFGFLINLFNLLPVLPLDGGRAMSALSPWIWMLGFLLFVGAAVVYPSPIIFLIVLFGGFETYRRWKQRKTPEARAYNRVSPRTRALVGLVYLGLVVALAVGVGVTHLERTFADV